MFSNKSRAIYNGIIVSTIYNIYFYYIMTERRLQAFLQIRLCKVEAHIVQAATGDHFCTRCGFYIHPDGYEKK